LFDGLAGLLAAASFAANAQNVQHLSIPLPGGMPGQPVMTGATLTNNELSITWDGPPGYYQLFERPHSNAAWQALGGPNLVRHETVSTNLIGSSFAVNGPLPHYTGSRTCAECHVGLLNSVATTAHAAAFSNPEFVSKGGQTKASCLPCHTVGYGLTTGFSSKAGTPKLEGVQCENCHGPAAWHAANPEDPTQLPRVELAATMCGGCHDLRFDEWKTSEHTEVIPNLNAAAQIGNCGRCHSASARLSLIEGQTPPVGDANLGIECMSCHDPHQGHGHPAQLRYPLASTNDYSMPTNGSFASHYNPKINVCGQCHNEAGASWKNTGSAPHYSPQYNMLLGTVGEVEPPTPHYNPSPHAIFVTDQCVHCHMPSVTNTALSNIGHSHKFTVDNYNVCLTCHPFPEPLAEFAQKAVSNRVQELRFDLVYWATNWTPTNRPALFAKYGSNAWEYTTPGQLSHGVGPTAAEQTLIPTNILKARFNVYMVLSDKSLGIHNPQFCVTLLDTAENWIYETLYP
jgi:formate-dependent nitrite reductase cytochrome c552 subunit